MEKIFSNSDCDSTNFDCVQKSHILKENSEPISEPTTNIVNPVHVPKLFSTEIPISDLNFINDDMMNPVNLKIGKNQSSMYFKKFDLKNVHENSLTCIIGSRGSGKSFVICTLAENLFKSGKIDKCIIIAPTDRTEKFYFEKLGISNVFYNYSSSIIKNIIEKQEKQKSKILLVLDDCITQKNVLKDESFLNLIMNGRHIGITLIFTMQFPMKISPEIRCNFDYVFLKQDCMISNQKRIYDHYAGLFPTFDFFKQILDQLTTNFGTIVINNSTKKQNFTDKVQWFTVDKDIKCKIPEFIFDKQITTLKSDLISIKPDSPAKVSKKTLETLENLDYSLLEEIVQCNMKIYDLVKYSLDDKKKTTLAKLILKSNNLIINSFV
jgi:energy-coupling factor transporter ATP-binding protein EcfA2